MNATGRIIFGFLAGVLIGPRATQAQEATSAEPAAGFVRPIDLVKLNEQLRALPADRRKLVTSYAEAARSAVLDVTDGCYPDTSFREHYRNLAERAKGAAVLASFEDLWPEAFRKHCRRETIGYLREIADEFNKHPNFQYEWQAAFWAAEAGIAAWFLWDELDPSLRESMANMVAFQADRFIDVRPATRYQGNTEAETVAWNSTICTLAVNMMPGHPHHAAWDRAAKVHLYNTFSIAADLNDNTTGDNGRPVKDWVVGANLYDDFGLENHDMFHIDYVFACYRFHVQGAVLYWLTGNTLPLAFRHHAIDVYDKLMLPCMNHEGFFPYVSDNDWKRYHNWTEACMVHAYMAALVNHPLAAGLEQRAASHATGYWSSFPKGFGYDNPYVCGKPWTSRIADLVLMHVASSGSRPEARAEPELDRALQGTFELKSANLLTHRSAQGSFRSFCRGRGDTWVRFVAPADESWMMLPLATNYRGQIQGKPLLTGGDLRTGRGPDWFWVMRQEPSSGISEVFVSLPDEVVLFIEYAPAGVLPPNAVIENTVAIEKPHRKLTVRYEGGEAALEYGAPGWQHRDGSDSQVIPGKWANIDNRTSFRFTVPAGAAQPAISLPEPGARGALRARTSHRDGEDHTACLVICPNLTARQTQALPAAIEVDHAANSVRCTAGQYVVITNLGPQPSRVRLPEPDSPELIIPPYTPAVWLATGQRVF